MENASQAASSGDYINAASDLAKVTNYYPWRTDLDEEAVRYLIQGGDAETTIQYFERPGMAGSLSVDEQILLGDAYQKIGDSSKAEVMWKEAAAQGESTPAYQRLVDLYLQQKDYTAAVGSMEKLLTLNPSDTQLYYRVGLLYAATEPLRALPFLAQAAEIDPLHASSATALHDKIRTANLFDQPAYILLSSGRQLANMGEWEYAGEAFRRATDLDPQYADAWAFLGEAEQQISGQTTSQFSEAGLAELQRALKADPNSVLANFFMGLYWERRKDYSQAQNYLEQAIALNSSDPYFYSELGNILSKAGDLPAAKTAYEEAIRISSPGDPTFYCLLAQFALDNQIQIRELALPAARQALMLDPQDANSLDVMAQVMLSLQDYHSAERYASEAIKSDPEFAAAYLHLGTAYLYLGQPSLAHQALHMAKNVEPDSWVAAQATRMLDYYFP